MSSAGIITCSPFFHHEDLHRFQSLYCSPGSILIYLAIPGANAMPMHILESDSVASIKLRIQDFKGFVVKKQKLVFGGRELARNDCPVRDYGVSDGNLIHLVIRLSDLRMIVVETACGKKFKVHVERNQKIAYVKQQIAKSGEDFVNLDDQSLIYDGEELDDELSIQDVFENNGAAIHLIVKKSAKVVTKSIDKEFELLIETELDEEEVINMRKPQPIPNVWIEPFVVNPKIELSQVVHKLIRSTLEGLLKGNTPILSSEGTGGAYFMQDASGEFAAVFKPIDEEPMAKHNPRGCPLSLNGEGLKRGTRVGEGAFREVAAYILDHPKNGRRSFMGDADVGFSGVPPTVMAQCLHQVFNHPEGFEQEEKVFKVGSLQMFVNNYGSCEDMGPQAFPVEEVHKISVLDIRLANADRHAGNILYCKEGEEGRIVLIPIDHGYCLPECFEDCTFEWLYWPQSRKPFNTETIEYIRSLDAEQDLALLKFYGWDLSVECARTLRISTMLLKKGTERGLTPFAIGSIMCRETLQKESKIEKIIQEAKSNVLQGTSEAAFLDSVSKIMDRCLDELAF